VINKLGLSAMMLMTLHIPPPVHGRGHGPPWQMKTNFWRYGVSAGDFLTNRKTQFLPTPPTFGTPTGADPIGIE